jgi:hypothetical protein
MQKKVTHPNWIGLYLTIAGILGIFLLEARASFSPNIHRFLEVLLVLILFAAIEVWLRANERALYLEDRERYRESIRGWYPSYQQPQTPILPVLEGELNKRRSYAAHVSAWFFSLLAMIGAFLHHKDL